MELYTLDTAMIRLKEIAECLESSEYDLEMSMKLYEEGVRLVSFCNKQLNEVKEKIVQLSELTIKDDSDE